MTASAPDLDISPRISALTAVLQDAEQRQAGETPLRDAGGDFDQAHAQLESNLSPSAIQKLAMANTIAEWSDNNATDTGPYTDEMRPFIDQMMNNRICVRVVPGRTRSWDHRKLGMPAMPVGGSTAQYL